MTKKYKGGEKPQPSHYKLALDCLHSPIMSHQEIKDSLVDSKYTPVGSDITVVCPLCSQHAPGSCQQGNIIHKVVGMTPMYSRQVHEAEQQHHEEQQQT